MRNVRPFARRSYVSYAGHTSTSRLRNRSRSAPLASTARTGTVRPSTAIVAAGSAIRLPLHAGWCAWPQLEAITTYPSPSGAYSNGYTNNLHNYR